MWRLFTKEGAEKVASFDPVASIAKASFSLPSAGWTNVPLDTLHFSNQTGLADIANNRFVLQTSGKYLVIMSVNADAAGMTAGTIIEFRVWKNGAAILPAVLNLAIYANPLNGIGNAGAQLADLVAGDILTLQGYNSGSAAVTIYPTLQIVKVA